MVAFAALCTASATYGMGVHAEFLSVHESSRAMLLLLSGQSVVAIAMGVSKFAVGVFLLRIVVNKWYVSYLSPHAGPPNHEQQAQGVSLVLEH